MASEATSEFDRATAVHSEGEGRFGVSLSEAWWAVVGPNGGYLSAIVLRGMIASAGDAALSPRSLHLRFLSTAKPGPAALHVTTLRAGRTVTILGASLLQGDREIVAASAAFGVTASKVAYCDARMPQLPPLQACELLPKKLPINARYDSYRGLGGELRKGETATSGGYIGLVEQRMPDVLLMAAVWDAWAPTPLFRRIEERFGGAAPTLEASVYFRAALPLPDSTPGDRFVVRMESLAAVDGYFEESGEVWSPGGVLLAQTRQLALIY